MVRFLRIRVGGPRPSTVPLHAFINPFAEFKMTVKMFLFVHFLRIAKTKIMPSRQPIAHHDMVGTLMRKTVATAHLGS